MFRTTTRRVGLIHLALIGVVLLAGVLLAWHTAEAQTPRTLSFVCQDRSGQLFAFNGTECGAGYTKVNLSPSSPAVVACTTAYIDTLRLALPFLPCMFTEQTVILHGPTETLVCANLPPSSTSRARLLLARPDGTCRSGQTLFRIAPSAPVAANDTYVTGFETPLTVAAPGVLANDASNSGTVIGFDAVSSQGGTVSVAPDGGFTYTPPAGFAGTDSFGYSISNGTATSSATVTIEVIHFTVANDDEYLVDDTFTGTVAAPGVLGNDEVNGATITAYDATTSAGGSVVLNLDGSFTYTAPLTPVATDTFTYTLTNPVGSSTATVTLNFNEPPTAVNDSYTVTEDGALNTAAPGVLGNDTDPDGDPLTAEL